MEDERDTHGALTARRTYLCELTEVSRYSGSYFGVSTSFDRRCLIDAKFSMTTQTLDTIHQHVPLSIQELQVVVAGRKPISCRQCIENGVINDVINLRICGRKSYRLHGRMDLHLFTLHPAKIIK